MRWLVPFEMTGARGGGSSLDDFGHPEERRLGIGRLLENFGRDAAGNDDVFAESGIGGLVVGQHLRHGCDVRGVEFVELADVFEDFVHLGAIGFELGLGEVEVGKFGDAYDVFAADFHGSNRTQVRSGAVILTHEKKSFNRRRQKIVM